MHGRCGYAWPGTYGHECGKPARWAQQTRSEVTADGVYWCARCDECRHHKGPDNAGLRADAWAPYDPTIHRNAWRRNRWPNPPEVFTAPA